MQILNNQIHRLLGKIPATRWKRKKKSIWKHPWLHAYACSALCYTCQRIQQSKTVFPCKQLTQIFPRTLIGCFFIMAIRLLAALPSVGVKAANRYPSCQLLGWCMWRLVAWRDWQILTIPHTKAPQKLGGWAAGWSIFSQLHYLLHRKVFSHKYIHMSVLLFMTRGFSYTMNPTLFLLSCYCFTTH